MALATTPVGKADAKVDLTPGEQRHLTALEHRIERGLNTFREVGLALLEIRDNRLFRMSHNSFEAYCLARWGMGRGQAYRLMGAAEVAEAIPEGPENEAQARELVPVFHTDPDLAAKVWDQAKKSGKPITAPLIREAVRQVSGTVVSGDGRGRLVNPTTATARLIARLATLSEDYTAWRNSKPTAAERKAVKAALADFSRLVG
jgi:hypothetical protein